MGLRVRYGTGPRAGEMLTFEDDLERIVLGRDPGRCQVVFPADERLVGREHCALERVLGRYRLVLNAADLVLVDGRPAVEGQELDDLARLQLGVGGPIVDVRTSRNPALAPTEVKTLPAQQTLGSLVAETASSARHGRRLGVLALLGLAAAGAVGWLLHSGTLSQVEDAEARRNAAEAKLQQALRDQKDLNERETRAVQAQFEKEKEALLATLAGFSKQVEALRPNLRGAVRAAAPSVYLMVVRSEGHEVGVATAFVVKPGVLATNAHVAEILAALPKGARFSARSSDPGVPDIPVREVRIHPARDLFKEVWQDYEPAFGLTSKSMERVEAAGDAFDVGLLVLEPGGATAPPLPLATREEVEALAVGEPIGYVGYPSENVALAGGRHPTATTHLGYVTAASDYFGSSASATPATRHLILHSLPAAGGASGSPILNERGHVVAVLSGGNIVGTGGKRVSTGVGVNFAQRSDLVAELLDERAQALTAERRAGWEQRLQEQFESGFVVRRDDITAALMLELGRRLEAPAPAESAAGPRPGGPEDAWTRVLDSTLALVCPKDSTTCQAVLDPPLAVEPKATWLVLVGAGQKKEIDVELALTGEGPPAPALTSVAAQPWLRYALFEPRQAGRLALRVLSPQGARECRILVLRSDRALRRDASPLDRLRDEWLEVVGREQGETAEAEAVHSSSERLGRVASGAAGGEFVLPLSLPEPGAYLVAAFAPGLADIDMVLRAAGSGAPLWIDQQTDNLPLGRLTTDKRGVRIEVRVLGPAAGIDFDLRVWRARRAAHR